MRDQARGRRVLTLRRAGLVHGLGRLGISNAIKTSRGRSPRMARAIRTDTPERISRPARNLAAADAYQAMHEPRLHRGPAGLTQREVEVLRLLARGLSNDAIAEQLVIAPKRRSGNHIEHVFARTGASTRAAAGPFAMQHGLLPEEEFPARPLA